MNNDGPILHSRYQIISQLGKGGFGTVYLAKDLQFNRKCVVKQLHSDASENQVIKRLFKEEATTLNKLDHPQIPHLIDYFEEEGGTYLAEDYFEGHTLTEELTQPWQESEVIELLKEILLILEYIHKQGVIHRDIKPDNFIRCHQDNKLALIDFGAVKKFNVEKSQLISRTVKIGTPGYMPIELAIGKPRKNSDIYALGIIAIQALTGKNPMEFKEDETRGELIWREFAPGVSSDFATILDKMIRSNYNQRYKSATEVLQDLIGPKPTQIIEPSSIPTRTFNEVDSPATLAPEISKFQLPWKSIVSIIALIIFIGGGGLFFYVQQNAKRKQEQQFLADLKSFQEKEEYTQCFDKAESDEAKKIIPQQRFEYIGECRLEEAKKQAQLSNYEDAIAIAEVIESSNLFYKDAQQLISDWKPIAFVNELKSDLENKLYVNCFQKAESNEAKQIIPEKRLEYIVECRLEEAKRQAELENYDKAIDIVKEIDFNNPFYWKVEELRKQWEEEQCGGECIISPL